jgi:hypothetical protein
VDAVDRAFVSRDERKLVSLAAQAGSRPELHDQVARLAPEHRLAASFVHFAGGAETPQLVEVWIPPAARVLPRAQEVHGIGFVLEGEMHLDGQVLRPGSSFFVPKRVAYSYQAGPQGLTFLGFRAVRPPDDGLNPLHGGWASDNESSDGDESAAAIRCVPTETRKWEVLQDRAGGNPALEEIVRALPPDERVTASFVHHRGSADEPQLIEVWLPPGIRIAPFTQEVHTLGFGLWGPGAGCSNSGRPGVGSQPFQVGPQGTSSIGFRPTRPPHLTVHTVHGGP